MRPRAARAQAAMTPRRIMFALPGERRRDRDPLLDGGRDQLRVRRVPRAARAVPAGPAGSPQAGQEVRQAARRLRGRQPRAGRQLPRAVAVGHRLLPDRWRRHDHRLRHGPQRRPVDRRHGARRQPEPFRTGTSSTGWAASGTTSGTCIRTRGPWGCRTRSRPKRIRTPPTRASSCSTRRMRPRRRRSRSGCSSGSRRSISCSPRRTRSRPRSAPRTRRSWICT